MLFGISYYYSFYFFQSFAHFDKKSGGTAGILYNNRHRQAPRTHTDIQAVRAHGMSEPTLYILVYFELYLTLLQRVMHETFIVP